MAPHRLILRESLRTKAERHIDVGLGDRIRFGIIRHTPNILIDHLVEVAVAIISFVVGLVAVTGAFEPSKLAAMLPLWVYKLYGCLLILGALTVFMALLNKRFGTILPMGLQLISATCFVYVIATFFSTGLEPGLTAISNSLLVALFSQWKAFILRATYILEKGKVDIDLLRKK